MQVKTFTGSSTQDVMAQVKAELGPDAIILASRELNGNGLRLFEITAGVERPAGSFGFSGTGPDPLLPAGRNGTRNGRASRNISTP